MVGKAVTNVSEFSLFDILFDGVEGLVLANLHFGVGPAGDLDDHVQDAIVLIGEERDVVEGGDDGSVLLDIDTMVWRDTRVREEIERRWMY